MWSALTSLLPGSHGSEARRGGTSSPIPPLSAPTSSTPQHDNPDRRQTRSKKREMPIPLKPPRREYLGTSVQNLHHERPENPEEVGQSFTSHRSTLQRSFSTQETTTNSCCYRSLMTILTKTSLTTPPSSLKLLHLKSSTSTYTSLRLITH